MNKARRRLARARRYRDRAYIPFPWYSGYMGGMSPEFPTKTEEQVARFVAEVTRRARKNKVLVITWNDRMVQDLRRLLPTNLTTAWNVALHVKVVSLWDAFRQSNLALNFRGHITAFPASNFKLRA